MTYRLIPSGNLRQISWKVTRCKKDKKSQSFMYKYTFIEVSTFIFKISKHFVINYTIIKEGKQKTGDIKQKECYKPNFKS